MSTNFRYSIIKTIKPYMKYFHQLTKPVLRILIQVSVHYIENTKCSPDVLDLALNKLTLAGHIIPENFCELFAAILQIMQLYLRTPKGLIKPDDLKNCLKEDLRLSDECVEDLTKVLYNHRETLTRNFVEAKTIRYSSKILQWRINISFNSIISSETKNTSVITNVPTVILHFQLPNGRFRTLELPISIFLRLRYNVAVLLNEMQAFQKRAIMKKF